MTQEWLAETSVSRGMNHHVLTMEYRRSYRILPRGDLALLYFTTDPLVPPHFFRRTPQGWVLDLWTEANDTRNYVGWWYTWAMLNTGDDFAAAFGDRYVDYGGAIRLLGGDNRPLPVKQYPGIRLEPPPEPEDSVADVTVEEAATTIGNAPGVALVILYPVWSQQAVRELPALTELARRCRDKGAAVLAFTIDHEPGALRYLPDLLRKDHAPFPPMHLTPWRHGGLTGAMDRLGIRIGSEWMPPIVAVCAGTRGVLIQAEGADVFATGMEPFESACGSR